MPLRLPTLFFILLISGAAIAQCPHIAVGDSSFEQGTLHYSSYPALGEWDRDDGCSVSGAQSYHLDSSACSNAGGGVQHVRVDTFTNYILSCFVLNGVGDPYLFLRPNPLGTSTAPASNGWSMISTTFNSGADTTAQIWFYSGGACWDYFQLTCEPDVGAPDSNAPALRVRVFPSVSAGHFSLETRVRGMVEVYDMQGRLRLQFEARQYLREFGQELEAGAYQLRFRAGHKIYLQKLLKIH